MYGLYNRVSTCFRYWLKWKIVFIWKKNPKKPKKHHWSLPRFLLNSFWVMKENKGRKLKMQMLLQEADWICISNTLGPPRSANCCISGWKTEAVQWNRRDVTRECTRQTINTFLSVKELFPLDFSLDIQMLTWIWGLSGNGST